jgi:hypothetical protein
MEPSKPRIGEAGAADLFFSLITDRVFEEWPEVLSELREPVGPKLIPDQLDEDKAKLELLFAAMALDLLALKNLFPPEQAHRLYERCIESIPAGARDIAKFAFEEYGSRFSEDVKDGLDPALGVGDILYGRWGLAGEAYVPGEYFVAMEPSETAGLAMVAFSYIGVWKQIRTNFIIEGGQASEQDLPSKPFEGSRHGDEWQHSDIDPVKTFWKFAETLWKIRKKIRGWLRGGGSGASFLLG